MDNAADADVRVRWRDKPDPNWPQNTVGWTETQARDDTIRSSDVTLSRGDAACNTLTQDEQRNLVTHEFGHVFGLGHTNNMGNVMDGPPNPATDEQNLSENDKNGYRRGGHDSRFIVFNLRLAGAQNRRSVDVSMEVEVRDGCNLNNVNVDYTYSGNGFTGSSTWNIGNLPALARRTTETTIQFQGEITTFTIESTLDADHPTNPQTHDFVQKTKKAEMSWNVDKHQWQYTYAYADYGLAPTPPMASAYHLTPSFEWLGDYPYIDDGVRFHPPYIKGKQSHVDIYISTSGLNSLRYDPHDPTKLIYINGWFDWNNDGDWDDPGEWAISASVDPLGFSGNCSWITIDFIPEADQPAFLWARFRLDYEENSGIIQAIDPTLDGPKGLAQFGEVEDYPLEYIPPVGGIAVPIDKFGLLAPYIGLASAILVATVATAIYVKRVKRRKKKQ